MRNVLKKYKHAWVLLYFFLYMIWFFYLNQITLNKFHPIEIVLDESIPFLEIFIIPYYVWFAYVPMVIAYFFFTSKRDYYRCTAFLFIGMTICLIIYSIYPNGVHFRPDLDALGRDNFLIDMTKLIYNVDAGTNVCPSIHTYNAIGVWLALHKSERMKKHIWIRRGAFLLSVTICLSTVFVKQHSILDVYAAMVLAAFMYLIVYVANYKKLFYKKINNS